MSSVEAASDEGDEVPIVDCLVLSGGGAKGAYGAGAAKGLSQYRQLRHKTNPICYIGTSSGALNAAILATNGADALVRFWSQIDGRSILGILPRAWKLRILAAWAQRLFQPTLPFHVYSNSRLRRLLEKSLPHNVQLVDANLVVTATNYMRAEMCTFYMSRFAEQIVSQDGRQSHQERRLGGWARINSRSELIECLLASCAIPIMFPLVCKNGDYLVDGGIGNHTPTRQAAYILRGIEAQSVGRAGSVFCVSQDPLSPIVSGPDGLGLLSIFRRTLDVYHRIHMRPILDAWERINGELQRQDEKLRLVRDEIQGMVGPQDAEQIFELLSNRLASGGATRRLGMELIEIEPTVDLGDTLNFDPKLIEKNLIRGREDMLQVLSVRGDIDRYEREELSREPIWGRAA